MSPLTSPISMLATSATLIKHQRSTSEWTSTSIRGTWPPSSWRRQSSRLISRGTSSISARVVSFSLFSLCLYVVSSKYSTGKIYTAQELNMMFCANNANRQGFKLIQVPCGSYAEDRRGSHARASREARLSRRERGSHVRRWKRRSAVRQHVVLVLRWA